MKQYSIINFVFIVFLYSSAQAEEFSGKDDMSGLSFKKYWSEMQTYKFVMSDYRNDAKFIQFVYANEVGFRANPIKGRVYPDGAVFAKVIYKTQKDPSFRASRIPTEIVSYEFMMRDAKKYQTTDGWGYAVFDQSGKTKNSHPLVVTQGCVGCHSLVSDRNYIFSVKINPFEDFKNKIEKKVKK